MQQTSVYIPKPCSEDWNAMTPTQQGKFCAACNKQVIDFSLMSDNQILNFLSQQQGKLCGRFDAQQLQRPLIETKTSKKKSWWMALTLPFAFLFERTDAQQSTQLTGDTVYNIVQPAQEKNEIILGKIAAGHSIYKRITGVVIDENNKPIQYASVIWKGTKHVTLTDSSGKFSLDVKALENIITIDISYIGYEPVEKNIDINKDQPINVQMKIHQEVSGVVEVVTVGEMSIGRKIRPIDTLKSSIKKICSISTFKVYPNPVDKGNDLHIEIKQPGDYEWQLLNEQSALIDSGEINTNANTSASLIAVPSNISNGIYYLCLINQKTKKRSVEKIIIQ